MFVVACFALHAVFALNTSGQNTQTPASATAVAAEPSESKQEADSYQWGGQKDEPKKIIIEKLGVNSFVQRVGIDKNNQIEAPNNIHLAGWFLGSVKPGQPGLSVIDGHVNWQKSDAVFKKLNQLGVGDVIVVELGGGELKKFKVFKVSQVKEEDAVGTLFSQNPKVKSQLNLITCGGAYDVKTRGYKDRVIVSAEHIE